MGVVIIILYFTIGVAIFYLAYRLGTTLRNRMNLRRNLGQLGLEAPTLKVEGFTYRDLNKNGQLDPYEDARVPIDERVEDLLTQLTLEEKAGMMFQTMIGINKDGTLKEKTDLFSPITTSDLVANRKMNHFNVIELPPPRETAEWYNQLQKMAERTRLGIPVTISSDPRHAFTKNPAASMFAGEFSLWPEQLGLAATRDVGLVTQFGDIARQEYLAVGIRVALHPMADLSTEPRWGRNNSTFGEDAELAAEMTKAYILGFQGEEVGSESVACMTKHFPGGGPQKDGEDAHFKYGKDQVYPGNNFDYHLMPFEAAFEAGTSQIMPYYGQPVGLEYEEVGFGFNKDIITGLLREKYGFDGIVCTDWMLLSGVKVLGREIIGAKDWGVESLSLDEKAKKVIDAGVDQFGGEASPEVIVRLVTSGQVSEERIDKSIRRLLREKFRLGLFENPYVDPDQVENIVGRDEFKEAGRIAQKKSIVLLKRQDPSGNTVLPLQGNPKIYVDGIEHDIARQYGQVVNNVHSADFAILRLSTPFDPRKGLLERFFHTGDLDFKGKEKQRILSILEAVPTIVDIYLERPAVIPEITE